MLALQSGSRNDAFAEPVATGGVGYQGPYFGNIGEPTARDPQSKLWFNDGLWWASMYNRTAGRFEIHRLDSATQDWSATGTAIDSRTGAYADTLWDGTHLYIASAAYPTRAADNSIKLLRYSYNAITRSYSLDVGFPVVVGNAFVIAVVIDKDSTGVLWMTYTAPHDPNCVDDPNGTYRAPTCTRDVFVTHGTDSSNSAWVQPYKPPVQSNTVTQIGADAIASLVKFGGNKVGLVWDHGPFSALYFTYHVDGAPDSQWSPVVTIAKKADNHINLKSLEADPNGKIYAVVKNDCNEPTGGGCNASGSVSSNDALLWLFTVDTTGVQSYTVSRVRDDQTRPILALDQQNRNLYVVATTNYRGREANGSTTVTSTITYKQTSMDNISFAEGRGIPFIQSNTSTNINNATTTKQSVNSNSNLVVLASDSTAGNGYYFHNVIYLNNDPVMVGAGDIADCARSGDESTAALLDGIPGTVFTVGDNVYPTGAIENFNNCYDPSWGRHKGRTRPAVGNHEYHVTGATGYYGYFGAVAGDPSKGYYSYDQGQFWHVIVLNSNCGIVSCRAGSAQEQWLRADLAANQDKNVIALFHHPRFSSGSSHGNDTNVQPFWEALYEYGADLVINGHSHVYERFAPQDPYGNADPNYGIRQIISGVGGYGTHPFNTPVANSQVRDNSTRGVLRLTLRPASYEWLFVPIAGARFTDWGTSATHGVPGSILPPSTATAIATVPSRDPAISTATSTPTATATPTAIPTFTATATSTATPVATATATATSTVPPPSATNPPSSPTLTSVTTPIAGQATQTPTASTTATAETQACEIRFADVQPTGEGSTFYSFVQCLACRNIIGGYPCGSDGEPCNGNNDPFFRPGDNVTRGQISKMVALAAGFAGPTGEQRFEDVAPNNTFYEPIQQLASRRYISGYPCGSIAEEPCGEGNLPYFRPSTNTTRGQLSKIVSEAAGYTGAAGTQSFADVPAQSTFFVWIERLASRNVIGGYTCGGAGETCDSESRPYFRPGNNVTRGQTAKIVANTFPHNCRVSASN